MTETETMTTDEVLAAMLTENTGSHMLDSGGAYGRNWQRNGGKAVADFRAAPTVELCTGARYAENPDTGRRENTGETVVDYVNLDVFHFLSDRLDFDADLDAAFREFAMADERKDESWFTCLDEWFEAIGATCDISGDRKPYTVNTYNGEDLLSQVVQYAMFNHPETDEPMVALSIHGGCDVRGGYTAPRMFHAYEHYSLMDNADVTVVLTEPDATPDAIAQAAMFPEYPTPVGGRQVVIDVRAGYEERYLPTGEDASLDAIGFEFGDTPITTADDGTMTIASGPAAGWEVAFYPPCAG